MADHNELTGSELTLLLEGLWAASAASAEINHYAQFQAACLRDTPLKMPHPRELEMKLYALLGGEMQSVLTRFHRDHHFQIVYSDRGWEREGSQRALVQGLK